MGRIRIGQGLYIPLYTTLLISSVVLASAAALDNVYVENRTDYQKGKDFGAGGAYEMLEGTVLVGGTRIPFDYLKPRDPVKANGTLLVTSGKASARDNNLIQRGYTFLRMQTGDAAAIREFVSYVRYGAPIQTFVLADQRRFIKRAVFVGDAKSVESVVFTNADPKNRPYFDAAVVTGKKANFTVPEKLKVLHAESKPAETIMGLETQSNAPTK
jgi:hypothetical protein